jgi:hypothetical protein
MYNRTTKGPWMTLNRTRTTTMMCERTHGRRYDQVSTRAAKGSSSGRTTGAGVRAPLRHRGVVLSLTAEVGQARAARGDSGSRLQLTWPHPTRPGVDRWS